MKFILSLLLVLVFGANGIKAASTTEEVCTTDSYGNRSCSSSTSTTSTSEVTYGQAVIQPVLQLKFSILVCRSRCKLLLE